MEPNSTLGEPVGVVHVTINGQKVPANVYADRTCIMPDGTIRKVKQEVVDGRTLSLTNERVLVKDGDSEVVFAPASYNADDIQFTDTKQTLSGFTVARSDYADSDSSKTFLVEGTDRNFLAVTNNEDLLNSILQVQ